MTNGTKMNNNFSREGSIYLTVDFDPYRRDDLPLYKFVSSSNLVGKHQRLQEQQEDRLAK